MCSPYTNYLKSAYGSYIKPFSQYKKPMCVGFYYIEAIFT